VVVLPHFHPAHAAKWTCKTPHHTSCTSKQHHLQPQSKLAWHRRVVLIIIVIAFACTFELPNRTGLGVRSIARAKLPSPTPTEAAEAWPAALFLTTANSPAVLMLHENTPSPSSPPPPISSLSLSPHLRSSTLHAPPLLHLSPSPINHITLHRGLVVRATPLNPPVSG